MKLKDETVLSLGILSLAVGILVECFAYVGYSDFSELAFVKGVLFGLSFVMNLFYLMRKSKKWSITS